MKKFLAITLIIFFLAIFLIILYWIAGRYLGLRYYMANGMTVDTMTPTLQKDIQFRLYPYKTIFYRLNPANAYKLQYGDIVTYSNEATKQIDAALGIGPEPEYYVVRVIALPGDTIEFKGGTVFLNGKPLDEPYTLTPNSTYAYKIPLKGKIYGNFLPECKVFRIPSNKLFALVDNREVGNDSRFLGLVDFNDINAYLPLKIQEEGYTEGSNFIKYSDNWRQPNTTLTSEALKNASTACK
jgi:signal peptidase I